MRATKEQRDTAEALKGKRIARVTLNAFDPNESDLPASRIEVATDPVVWFTDGTCLRFVVQETEVGKYGVELIYPGRGSK